MAKAQQIDTVDELIEALLPHKGKKIISTWEGITQPIHLYLNHEGKVLLDCDDCNYQVEFQKLKCEKCGSLNGFFVNKGQNVKCGSCVTDEENYPDW